MVICSTGTQCKADTELWPDESTRCVCSEGQLSCSRSQSTGMCTIHGHTDCSTFDGVLFRFMSPCSYTLAKTCTAAEDSPQFSVEVVNGQNGNLSSPSVEQVNVNIHNFRMSLLKRQTRRVVVSSFDSSYVLTVKTMIINFD